MRERRGRIVSILLIFTLVIGILQPIGTIKIKATEVTRDDAFTWSINYDKSEAEITGLTTYVGAYEKDFVIPSTYSKYNKIYPVTKIGRNAFKDNTKLTSVIIPDSVKEIDERAFSGCINLESITIPSSVKKLGYGVFQGCKNLKKIELSNGLEELHGYVFDGCVNLESIVLPESLKVIGGYSFNHCEKLETLELPKNLERLETAGLFGFCSNLTKITNFPQNITAIQDKAFYACNNLETVGISFDNITQIGEYAFAGCLKLEDIQEIVLKNKMTFGLGAFSNSCIQSITVKENMETIPKSMFAGCAYLRTANFSSIGYIEEFAFDGSGIKKIDIGGAYYIKECAFRSCRNLTNIDLSSVRTIDSEAFKSCENLTSVNFSNNLSEIRSSAFRNCDKLTDIYIPNSVTKIGTDVFKTSMFTGTVVTNLYSDNVVALNYNWVGDSRNVKQHSVDDYDKVPNVIQASRTYRKANPNDISFAVDLGRGSKAATDITGVMIDYMELEESSYELSGSTLIIKKEALTNLSKGVYDVGVTFNDTDGTSITGLLSILVVESSSSDNNNGDNSKPPVALETLSYQFYKDYQRDIVVPIQMNSANTLEELYLGTDLIDKDKYSFTNDTIILDKNYLDTVSAGLYRLIPVFDGDKKINNLLLEIYDKYDDRLLPYLLPSHISFKNQDLRLKVELGEGKTKAKNIKLLVIDDMYITPNGEIHQKNPLTYGRTASGAAIIKSRIQTYFSLGKNLVEVEVKSPKAYYLDGDELVLTANLIKKLGFVADSVHTVGCIFDNSEETASLNRVTLVIPNQQNDSDNSGDQNNGNNSNQGNNSNGDSNNSDNQNNGNNNNQGNNFDGDSNSSGNQNNGNNNNQGSNSNGDSNSSSNQNNGNNNNQGSNSNGSSSNSGNQTSGGGANQGTNANESNNSFQQHENGVLITETITLKDIIYTGKSDVIIPLTKVNEIVAHIKLNGRELKKEEYQIVGNQLVLFRSTLNQLKDGTNGITIQTKSDIPRTYIAFIQFDFSKQESKIPFMTTYKLLLKGSKFPVYLSNQKEAKKITWNTSNSKIVSVSKKGVLTARKKGKATVTCVITNKKGDLYKFQIKVTVKDGKKKSFYTKVKNKPYDSNFPVFIMDKLVYKGKTVHIKVSNLSKDSKISYKSSNPSIATVDKKGNIKGRKKGKATIIVTLKQNKETYIYQLQCQCK